MDGIVKCPICRTEQLLSSTRDHIWVAHAIRVSSADSGFSCQKEGCHSWLSTYKSWKRHVRNHLENEGVAIPLHDEQPALHMPNIMNQFDDSLEHAELHGSDDSPECCEVEAVYLEEEPHEVAGDSVAGSPMEGMEEQNDNSNNSGDNRCSGDEGGSEGFECEDEDGGDTQPDNGGSSFGDEEDDDGDRDPDDDGGSDPVSSSGDEDDGGGSDPDPSGDEDDGGGSDPDPSGDEGPDDGSDSSSSSGDEEDNNGDPDPDDPASSSDDEEDNGNNGQALGREEITAYCAYIIASLRGNPTTTRAIVTKCIGLFEELQRQISEATAQSLENFLGENDLLQDAAARALLQQLRSCRPFEGMRSSKGQISAIKRYFKYVAPQTIFLGQRIDQVNVGHGRFRQRPVHETFQYVPVIETLKYFLAKPRIMDYVQNRRPRQDILESYTDGRQYQHHQFLQQHPDAFQLMLYYDDVEVVGALGSKCSIHNLACFYLEILNIPPYINSMLKGIHTVILANYQDLRDRGFQPILQPLVDDLLRLESEEGVLEVVNGVQVTIRAVLVAVAGDAKALHEILGFLACGARCFCASCMLTRNQLHAGHIIFGEPRTRELHDQHLFMVAVNGQEAQTETGVKGPTPLHQSQYFHATKNRLSDPMHDLSQGVIGVVVNLSLRELVCVRRLFGAWIVNRRLKSFNYGRLDQSNKPTPNFEFVHLQQAQVNHQLKQTAAQTYCLLRVLPFILDGLGVEEDNPHLVLIRLLQRIVDIAIAPRLRRGIMDWYGQLLREFRERFRNLYPEVSEINKQHHIMHYPEFILEMGPLRQFSCLKDERKHRPLKRHIATTNNFKNVPKTAAECAQIGQVLVWGTMNEEIEVSRNIWRERPRLVRNCATVDLLQAAGLDVDAVVRSAEGAEHHGFDFCINDMILTRSASANPNDLHSFGKLVGIIVRDETLWLEVEEWRSIVFDEGVGAFIVEPIVGGPVLLLDVDTLPLHPALSIWVDYTTEFQYISLKHFVI